MTNRQAETETTALHAHASAVDTGIAESYQAWRKAEGYAQGRSESTMHAAGYRSPQSRHDTSWRNRAGAVVTLADALDLLRAKGDERIMSYGKTGNEIVAALDAAWHEAHAAEQAYYQAEQAYEGWSRFFLVPGGHVHSSMDCSTCNHLGKRTAFGWLPELSGLTEAEAVQAHGPTLCTVCYPSAPVEWTLGQLNADGEYVAPKAYCPGSNTRDVDGEIRSSGYRGTRYARCSHCGEVVTFTGKGLRKHGAKDVQPEPQPETTPEPQSATETSEHCCSRCGYDFTGKSVPASQTVCRSTAACERRQAARVAS